MAGFIQFMRCEASDELLRHPNAFALLALIAQRARRDVPLINPYGLQIGEALVGDSAAVGLTRQEFRTALSNLQKWSLVTIRTTNKGTIAKLSNSAIYDINADTPNQQSNQTATSQQPTANQRTTTKKKERIKEVIIEEVNSSLRSEDAATAAAIEPEKKIEAEEYSSLGKSNPESPDASASHTRGAADVGTRKKTRRPRPEPGPATVRAYRLPDWATEEFTQRLEEWLVRRQERKDCRPLQADSVQARIDELAEYDEAFCLNLFRQAKQNPHWQGLTFDNTPLKFTQHIQQLSQLQPHAARQNQPVRGAQPTGAAASGAYSLAERLALVDEEQRQQRLRGLGSHSATGAYTGQSIG